jgi:diguanylate cyclase (GGDEF)-like protein
MTARRAFHGIRIASLIATAVIFVVFATREWARLGLADAVFLGGATLAGMLLSYLSVPPTSPEHEGRLALDFERIPLLFPVVAAIFVAYGGVEAAAVNLVAYVVLPRGLRRRSGVRRFLGGVLRAPIWFAIQPFHDAIAHATAPLGFVPLLVFVGIFTGWYLAASFLWIDLLAALRQARGIWRLWRVRARNSRALCLAVTELAWGYVIFEVLRLDGAELGLAMLIPLLAGAVFVLQLTAANERVHRLTLSREAVEAMLVASDPVPQIRSIVETVDRRIMRESVEIFAFGCGGSGEWVSVARLGPTAPAGLSRPAMRALYDLHAHGAPVEAESATEGVAIAYAATDDEKLLGALVVYRAADTVAIVGSREFERAAHELAPVLSNYGAIAATRIAAQVDTLTGLVNRRTVTDAVDAAMAYVRAGGSYAMLLIDVDHFKSINDLLGHNAGDQALARIGAVIAGNLREGDVAGRFGGEEFIVIMRDAPRERALAVAERLRSAIERSGVAYASGKPITISIGVTYAARGDASSEAVIERADRALYRAKRNGRNQVVESPLSA